ncbi:MAG: cupin domain-containing protein [Saccharospirillum sp.]|nr:cupin domain-containing protein [Saccharospirillum sp.]
MMQPFIKAAQPDNEYYFDEGCYIIEYSNSDADPDVSIARALVKPGQTTRWHHLTETTERYVITEGRGVVEVGDLEPTEVGPGDTVIIPPGCRQRITNNGSTDLVFLAICSPRFLPSCYEDIDS